MSMNVTVQARIGDQERRIVRRLKRRYGWSESDVVRHALHFLDGRRRAADTYFRGTVGAATPDARVEDVVE